MQKDGMVKKLSLSSGKSKCGMASVVALCVLLAGALGLALFAVFMPQVENMTNGAAVDATVTVVHAKWCGHCTTLLKTGGAWEKLKSSLPGVKFQELDEASLKGKAAVKKFDISGFPDIRIVGRNGATLDKYSGERTPGAMKAWILKTIPKK